MEAALTALTAYSKNNRTLVQDLSDAGAEFDRKREERKRVKETLEWEILTPVEAKMNARKLFSPDKRFTPPIVSTAKKQKVLEQFRNKICWGITVISLL